MLEAEVCINRREPKEPRWRGKSKPEPSLCWRLALFSRWQCSPVKRFATLKHKRNPAAAV
ncbi:hypothetical protein RR48_07245 [Papilio machaon]|uniref:Uncharacterized protein n=1 Tax=Papilio machaon TaxID=76193 RepID=A0A194RR55_PAPMA|nr:hypothetical protein RR48_07245 [Papilio machaon]